MKIQELYNCYEQQIKDTKNVSEIFEKSKMVNEYGILEFGFFPIGSGIFTSNSKIVIAKIENCEIMVLGNDFGTIDYVKTKCSDGKEQLGNPTIKNLFQLDLNLEKTFFTNLFLGLRIDGKNTDNKMVTVEYRNFCFAFFKKQLELIKPKIVICLGAEVMKSLSNFSTDFSKYSNAAISKLYADSSKNEFVVFSGGIKFVFIPHPSYAHINWTKNNIKQRITEEIKTNM